MFFLQFLTNTLVFLFCTLCLILNRSSLILTLMCIEMLMLCVNLNFILLSLYFDDVYGQLFSLFILTVVAGDSGIGLAIIILYYRLKGHIQLTTIPLLRY